MTYIKTVHMKKAHHVVDGNQPTIVRSASLRCFRLIRRFRRVNALQVAVSSVGRVQPPVKASGRYQRLRCHLHEKQ